MEVTKVGIVGFGNMGSTHAKNLADGLVPGMELSAICDIRPERLRVSKELYPEVACFENATELFKSGLVDTVVIATPHYDHPPLTIEALENNLNVITEKPAGVYAKQVMEMNRVAEKSGKLFGIMYNLRTFPIYQKLKEMIDKGMLGNIKRVTWTVTHWYRLQGYHDSCDWRSTWAGEGGGALINQNPHQIDLWQWFFGMPDTVMAYGEFGKYRDIEVDDEVVAYMKYKSGMTGVYIASTGECPGTYRLEIACDMGQVIVENDKIIFYRNEIPEPEYNKANMDKVFGAQKCWKCEVPCEEAVGGGHAEIMKDFRRALEKGTPLLAPGTEGIHGLILTNAMYYSAWTGKKVSLDEFSHDEFYDLLKEKIAHSRPKRTAGKAVADLSNTFSK